MRVEEYVGQQIRARRDELGMTLEEFGRRVGGLLGKPWSRQTAWGAEQGKRAFTAAELVAIAHVLETRPARLLLPPADLSEVEMPGGNALSTRAMEPVFGIADAYLSAMWDDFAHAMTSTEEAQKALKRMGDKLTNAIAAREVATMNPPERPEGEA